MSWLGRGRILASAAALLAFSLVVEAQQTSALPRVGYLVYADAAQGTPYLAAFRAGLSELGHIDGRTVVIEARWAELKPDRMATLAAELINERKVDVMVIPSCGALYMEAIRSVSKTVPLVVAICGDLPGFMGDVASFARPGGNTTGQTIFAPELGAKRLSVLRELVPDLSKVFILWNPASKGWDPYWRELRAVANALGIELQSIEIRAPSDFDATFRKIEQSRAVGILTLTDPVLFQGRQRIITFARTRGIAAAYDWREFADDGGLISYGASGLELLRRASFYVDKILRGAQPADLPIQQPSRLELVVNLRTAKALGISVPSSLVLRADHVIE